jgi:hypothetical protein
MRKTKRIKIDDLEITVKELRVKDIRQIIDRLSEVRELDQALELLPLLTDLPAEKIDDLAPSELNQVWEAAREVNAFFLDLMKKTGLVTALTGAIQSNLTEAFAGLSNGDTPTALTTDTASL